MLEEQSVMARLDSECHSPNTHVDVGVSVGSVISDSVPSAADHGAG